MASATSQIIERGVATLPDETWEQARRRTEIISPLAALEVVGHRAADAAALVLGLSRRQIYALIRRAREGAGLVMTWLLSVPEAAEVRGDCRSLSSVSFANC